MDVLIDLNGHTLRSGLHLFHHRPARVQVSFLGYPLTTAEPAVDFYIGDQIVTPHWMQSAFTEKLVRGAVFVGLCMFACVCMYACVSE